MKLIKKGYNLDGTIKCSFIQQNKKRGTNEENEIDNNDYF